MESILEGNKIVVDLDDELHNQVTDSVDIGTLIETREGVFNWNWQFPPPASSDSRPTPSISKVRTFGERDTNCGNVVLNDSEEDDDKDDEDNGFVDLDEEEEPDIWIINDDETHREPTILATDQRQSLTRPKRNLPISAPCITLDFYSREDSDEGITVFAGASVELRDGHFMKIVDVVQDINNMVVTVRGWLLKRNTDMEGNLELHINELCWVMLVDEDDGRHYDVQGMVSIPFGDVLRHRQILITNQPYPSFSWQQNDMGQSDEVAKNKRELVCRLKYIRVFADAKAREQDRASETVYQQLRAEECIRYSRMENVPCAAVDEILRDIWRGETVKMGACTKWWYGEKEFLAREANDHGAEERSFLNTQRLQLASSMKQGAVAKLITKANVHSWSNSLNSEAPSSLPQLIRSVDLAATTTVDLTVTRTIDLTSITETTTMSTSTAKTYQSFVTAHYRPKRSENVDLPEDRRAAKASKLTHGSSAAGSRSIDAFNRHRYTFGDAFCGAGGASRGAVSAGLRVKWGFDFDLKACKSYALNFFDATIFHLPADEFISLLDQYADLKVDVLHISPPCCPFSPAHTTPGQNDEMNQAALFAVGELLKKVKPRVVTLEQTQGLITRHAAYFRPLISMFTSLNFSVRWKVVHMVNFGLSQRRKRLVVIASCPGEVLPPFPKETHCEHPLRTGRKPWVSINEAINRIPTNWDDHDIAATRSRASIPNTGEGIERTMTTSGAGMAHPSGKRTYTYREFACLQSFPLGHKFGAKGVKNQIGNAVPPCYGKILLEEVTMALKKADRVNKDLA